MIPPKFMEPWFGDDVLEFTQLEQGLGVYDFNRHSYKAYKGVKGVLLRSFRFLS